MTLVEVNPVAVSFGVRPSNPGYVEAWRRRAHREL
jgi:hypothetical protein